MTPSLETMEFESQDYSLKSEATCIRLATAQGLEIFSGTDHILVFDLDTEESQRVFAERVHFLVSKFAMVRLVVSKSKSGNQHAVAYLDPSYPPIPPELRLAIQACMGSD